MKREERRNSPEGQARYEEIKREMRNNIPEEIKRLLNDEIDEWIFEKLGLIPGCCSSILELEYNIAREVAEALWPKNGLCNEKTLDGKVKLQLTIVRDND